MIRHTVSFSLKYPKGSPEEEEFLNATLILKDIPGIQHFERLIQTSKKNKYQYGLSMEFSDRKAYDQYNSHPIHTTFLQRYWIPWVEDFLETDYEPFHSF